MRFHYLRDLEKKGTEKGYPYYLATNNATVNKSVLPTLRKAV